MTPTELDTRNARAHKETLVIARTEDGFRVYNPAEPARSYQVGGGPDAPNCTCADFRYHEGDPQWRCKHILAVLAQLAPGGRPASESYEASERAAIQNESASRNDGGRAASAAPPQMVIKRSVSPDGRIDSLSVEFSCPLNGEPVGTIKERALRTLDLQGEIVASFLARRAPANGHSSAVAQPVNGGPIPAQMLTIGAINTKWGRRLYIAIQADGQTLKLFGSRKNLADALVGAGYPQFAEQINEGKPLNAACRVVTRPSEDGRYLNIEQLLPPAMDAVRRRW